MSNIIEEMYNGDLFTSGKLPPDDKDIARHWIHLLKQKVPCSKSIPKFATCSMIIRTHRLPSSTLTTEWNLLMGSG